MRILIIRHADPDYAIDSLTEKGWREAKLLADRFEKEKIDYFYSSPLGRAKNTCIEVAKRKGMEEQITVQEWLKEFPLRLQLPGNNKETRVWDILPEYWTNESILYDRTRWLDWECYKNAGVKEEYEKVGENLYALLAKHGYERDGGFFRVTNSNADTIAFFCHFGIEMVLLSHIFGVSPIPLLHNFAALPSSVTTLYSEERREGIASFRCCGFGDMSHLFAAGEEPSFAARFCERFTDDTRHD